MKAIVDLTRSEWDMIASLAANETKSLRSFADRFSDADVEGKLIDLERIRLFAESKAWVKSSPYTK